MTTEERAINTAGDSRDTGESTALVPRREQTVDFYGDGIPVAQAPEGDLYVALRPITDHLGLSFSSQRNRVLRDRVMAPRARTLLMTAADGKQRELLCLPLDLLPGWLFGVATGRVQPALVDKVDRYRADCFRVLWDAFKGDAAPLLPTVPESVGVVSGAALALEIATAVQHLAQNQLELERQVADVASRHDVMADYVRGFIVETKERLSALEQTTGQGAVITDGQATEIALAVKAIGQRIQASGARDGYAQVYAALYRRYRISSYKALPATRYDEVVEWLHRWYLEVAPSEDAPVADAVEEKS